FRAVAGRHVFGELRNADLARAKLIGEAPVLATGRQDEVAARFAELVAAMLRRCPGERPATAAAALSELLALRALARSRAHPVTGGIGEALTSGRPTVRTRIEARRFDAYPFASNEPKHQHRYCFAGTSALVLALLTGGTALGTALAVRGSASACAPP